MLLSDDEVGIRKIGPGQLRVNFNISTAMQEAILQLIEQQLAEEAVQPATSGNESNAELHASGYYALFADTVPMMFRDCILKSKRAILLLWHKPPTASKGHLLCLI